MKEILITGATGLIGSRIVENLSGQYKFHPIDRISYANPKALEVAIDNENIYAVIHSAVSSSAVDEVEKQRNQGKESEAWKVNVIGSEILARFCQKYNKLLLINSSSYVHDGQDGPYTDSADHRKGNESLMSFYAITKRHQEIVTADNCDNATMIRFEMPYRASFNRLDFARKLLDSFKQGNTLKMTNNQTITPIFIDELVKATQILIESDPQGPINVGSSDITSPYEFACMLIQQFYGDEAIARIISIPYTPDPNRAPRPQNGGVINGKVITLGYKPQTNQQMINELHKTMSNLIA